MLELKLVQRQMKNSHKIIISVLTMYLSIFEAQAKNACTKYEKELSGDQEYRVVFGDSGVGGLIFALDVAQELEPKLRALETQYKVNFTFNHFGDSKNAPYGNKKPKEIRAHTTEVLEYLLSLPNTHSAVIACNSTSAVYDDEMSKFFAKKYRDITMITMIEESSAALIKSAEENNDNQNAYIALLATPATIKSNAYQDEIAKLTKGKNVKLYSYSPQNWVKNIENGTSKSAAEFEVNSDLETFKSQMGQDFHKINALGLFCTHYPFYKEQIREFFGKHGNPNVTILTQGHIFSEKIYADIEQNLRRFVYQKRTKPLPLNCTKGIKVDSELSGDNIEQTKEVIARTHPQYLEKISFKKVTLN